MSGPGGGPMSGGGTPVPATSARAEVIRIAASMTAVCAVGALILGGVYLATERYAEAARKKTEREAVTQMLGLDEKASVLEVSQYLTPDGNAVVYRSASEGGAPGKELVFSLDGALIRSGSAPLAPAPRELRPLGRVFAARRNGAPAGFLVEGEARGYKNRIRFFVALDTAWTVQGVRVVEHEEDPGLGAEVATPWFQGQFAGRRLADVPALDVTKDPMPEDWRGALRDLGRLSPTAWQERHGAQRDRELKRPIYAVTGATISSRAFTQGVRATILHFRKRWERIAPYLEPDSREASR
jgi:H+/Na+-translocating ferredoxin:NAD+ oxidoreductase subunit G